PGAATPTGTVTFLVDGVVAGHATLVNGVATFVVSNLAAGIHSFSAVYSGGGTVAGSSSGSLSQVIQSTNPGGGGVTPTPTPTSPAVSLAAKVLSQATKGSLHIFTVRV